MVVLCACLGRAQPAGSIPAYHPSRILVQPLPGTTSAQLAQAHRGTMLRSFPGLGGLQVVALPPGEHAPQAARRCRESGRVAFAEVDGWVELDGLFPNDPKFQDGSQWGLHNTGQQGGVADADIDAPEGWAVSPLAPGVVVAVIDTGIRFSHEDLAGNLWSNPKDGTHGFNALAGNHDPLDDAGHGTMVAGIIGGIGNNGLGVAGTCWRVQIMACKFAGATGGFISDAITCLDFARTNGAHVINTSWGTYEESQSLSNVLAAVRQAGIVVVASVGNDFADTDISPYYPASFPFDNLVSVGGTTRRDAFYDFSNYGLHTVGLAAPAEEILSTFHRSDNDYFTDDGTSFAAGYVSGAAALLRAWFPGASSAWISQRLLASADPVPSWAGQSRTGGRLNLARALNDPLAPLILQARRGASPHLLELQVRGEPSAGFVLQGSSNLASWRPLATNQLSGAGLWMGSTNALLGGAQSFFRVHY